jgi:DNA-binding winged helix-turn-helix (wHTH) protein
VDPSGDTVGRVTFGVFEADLRVRELRRQHIRVRLPDQSFLILSMLLEHPGELVKREEIRKTLWPADTFVDFDHGLNNAINRLREALGDSADSPRFIETLPRRGYRFIGNVNPSPAEKAATLETPPAEQLAQDPGIDAASRKRSQFFEAIRYRWLLWSISALLAVALLVAFELRSVPLPPSSRSFVLPPEGTIFNLIGDAGGSVAVSVDGTKLAFVTIDPKGTSLIWIRHLGKLNADPL